MWENTVDVVEIAVVIRLWRRLKIFYIAASIATADRNLKPCTTLTPKFRHQQ
jgi:hypothetical protein